MLHSQNSKRQVVFGYFDESADRPSVVTFSAPSGNDLRSTSTMTWLVSTSDDISTVLLGESVGLLGGDAKNLPDHQKYRLIREDQNDDDWDPNSYDWNAALGFDALRWMLDEWNRPRPPEDRERCVSDCTGACERHHDYMKDLVCPFYAPAVMLLFTAPSGPAALFAGAAAIAACSAGMTWAKGHCRNDCERRCR